MLFTFSFFLFSPAFFDLPLPTLLHITLPRHPLLELDPHGADEQGNPLGGITFTNGFGKNSAAFQTIANSKNFTNDQQYTQVIEWIDFIGSGTFCIKMCNPDDPNAASLCNHIYDEIGCAYNAVADYGSINGTFTVCDSDDMDPPGVYTTNGVVSTWFQSQSPFIPPYTPTQVASSNCQTYASSLLFAAAATDPAVATTSSTPSSASTPTNTSLKTSSSGTTSRSGSGSAPSATGNGALASFQMGAIPFVVAGLMTTLATMMTILA